VCVCVFVYACCKGGGGGVCVCLCLGVCACEGLFMRVCGILYVRVWSCVCVCVNVYLCEREKIPGNQGAWRSCVTVYLYVFV